MRSPVPVARMAPLLTVFVVALTILPPGWAAAADHSSFEISPQFARRIAEPVSVDWSHVELRPALERLSEVHRIAVIIDRRVDPSQELTLSINETPLGDVLARVA